MGVKNLASERPALVPSSRMMASCRICVVLLFTALLAGPAYAQSSIEKATSWGILGTWMIDCSKKLDTETWRFTYFVRQGQLYHGRETVPKDKGDTNAITAVTVGPDGRIEFTIYFAELSPPQTRKVKFIKGKDGRIRAWENQNTNTGEYSVRDGIFAYNGATTPWQTHCR